MCWAGGGRRRRTRPCSCSQRSRWAAGRAPCRASCPVAKPSASPSHGHLLPIRHCCSWMSPPRRSSLGRTLRRLAPDDGGRGLLIATHDAAFARAHADRVAILAEGVVVEAGSPVEVLDRPGHPATRALLAAGDG